MQKIEPAGLEDLDELVELESMLFAEDAGVHEQFADVTWPTREGADDFRRLLGDADAVVLVARGRDRLDAALVGYATLSGPTRLPARFGVLRSMYVRADVRGAGIGQQLTESFIAWARRQNCDEVHVDSYVDNVTAGRLYERCGFIARSTTRSLHLSERSADHLSPGPSTDRGRRGRRGAVGG
jgi:GNAT superfamily N-acetyltransferase